VVPLGPPFHFGGDAFLQSPGGFQLADFNAAGRWEARNTLGHTGDFLEARGQPGRSVS
jgi:hypothetical protein